MGCGSRRGRGEDEGGREEGEGVVQSREGSLVRLSLQWNGPNFR